VTIDQVNSKLQTRQSTADRWVGSWYRRRLVAHQRTSALSGFVWSLT